MELPVELNHEVFGEGPDLVILHGLFGSLDNWRGVARQLARDFRVWLVDQRNHGQSPHSPEFHHAAMVEDLRAMLDRHALPQVHLLGHSMGGKVAMLFAARYPGRVARLIVEDMGPGGYRPRHEEIFRGLLELPLERLRSRRDADRLLREQVPDDAVRGFLLKNLSRREDGGWAWRFNLPVLFAGYRQLLAPLPLAGPVGCPTLFVRGELSDYLDPVRDGGLLEWFVRRELATIEGAGHWVHADRPAAFLQAVVTFLQAGQSID